MTHRKYTTPEKFEDVYEQPPGEEQTEEEVSDLLPREVPSSPEVDRNQESL